VKNDDPSAVTYTVTEVMQLLNLDPDSEKLRRIHAAKEVFNNSKIVNINLKTEDSTPPSEDLNQLEHSDTCDCDLCVPSDDSDLLGGF